MQNHVVIALFPHTVLHYTCSQISETIFTWRTESVLAIVKFCRYSLRGSMIMHKLMLWLSNILHSLNQLTQRSTALCLSSVAKSYCAHALFEATRLADRFSGSIRGHGGQHHCDPRISDWNRSESLVSVLKAFGSILKMCFSDWRKDLSKIWQCLQKLQPFLSHM